MKKSSLIFLAFFAVAVFAGAAQAQDKQESIIVKMETLDMKNGNKPIGEVIITESEYGLVFTPALKGITPGIHGFHIHMNPSCEPNKEGVAGMAAGGHWSTAKTNIHSFPWDNKGHKGDLPALYADHMGNATNPVLAPKLKKLSDVKSRSVMIHFGGDNHSDSPAALGGGGARFACGVIK